MDALALGGDEGRRKLRKAPGSCFMLRSGDARMGKPDGSHVPSSPSEFIGGRRRTGGIEPSQYPQEKKATAIPGVAASETGTA